MYQQTRLADLSAIGAPGPIPYVIENWQDDDLADLDAMQLDPQFELSGMGFWPVDVTEPTFDPTHQVLVPPTSCDEVDAVTRRWTAVATVREMTEPEYLTANPVPENISDRQCFQQLAVLGKVTPDEALAAVRVGSLPQAVTDGIAKLPTDQQFAAKMVVCGATEFHRQHPMVLMFFGFVGIHSSAEIDTFWRDASLL